MPCTKGSVTLFSPIVARISAKYRSAPLQLEGEIRRLYRKRTSFRTIARVRLVHLHKRPKRYLLARHPVVLRYSVSFVGNSGGVCSFGLCLRQSAYCTTYSGLLYTGPHVHLGLISFFLDFLDFNSFAIPSSLGLTA
jgi:hypothetical protein